jgi:hypothetical protein
MKKTASPFALGAQPKRSDLEVAAARMALRSIQESIGALEHLRTQAGLGSWLRPPTKW